MSEHKSRGKKDTLPAISKTLKALRCCGFMVGKIALDLRINGHYMGEEIKDENNEKTIYYKFESDEKLDTEHV